VKVCWRDEGTILRITNELSGNTIQVPTKRIDEDIANRLLAARALNTNATVSVNEAKYLHSIRIDRSLGEEYTFKGDLNCWGCGTQLAAGEVFFRRNRRPMCEECIELTPSEIQQNYQAWKRANGVR